MKIGVGCTTYNRPDMLEQFYCQLEKLASYEIELYIEEDTDEDRRGVAARKNECLRALQHCDHVFLFDDDCYPIKKGWEDFFINSGYNHLLFLNEYNHNFLINLGDVEVYRDCGGVFMYMTKGAIERVGAFDEKYQKYGFEHADYSCRISGGHGQYPMLKNTSDYLYSEDYSNQNHISSITNFQRSMYTHINYLKWQERTEEDNNKYIPL